LRIKGVKGNLDIIPNGFSKIEDLPSIPDSLAERNSKRPLLVFVGRLSYQKGLDILMDAVDKFETDPGFDLAIAGKGELSEWLKERHAKLGRSKIVKILGLVTDSEKLWLYENATAVVIPSRFEGLPTVLLEAMYSSCPVIMSDVNGLGSLVSESNSGLSTLPENPEILSRMMHEIANSEIEQLSIWGNNGFETSKKYLWSSVTENILQVYKRVLE
jgi:glycosyltransferase involved in cell wall biosynthesis